MKFLHGVAVVFSVAIVSRHIFSRRTVRRAVFALCLGLMMAPWHGYAQPVLRVADQKGLQRALLEAAHALDGLRYRIEWSEFPAAAPLLQALSANAVDTGVAGDGPFLFAYEAGNDVRATIALQPRAAGRSLAVIVPAASPIKTASDLTGHHIATGRGSIGHALLLGLEQKTGLQADIVFLSPSQSAAALHAGSVDAWATWEPYIALEEQNGARAVAYGTGMIPYYGFQVSNSRALATKHALLADFYQRLGKAYIWGSSHPHDYAVLWSQQMGLPLAVAEKTAADMLTHLVPIDANLVSLEQTTVDLFRHAKAVPEKGPDLQGAFDFSFKG
jgi:sulfonate transport system substrate-binding protein